MMKENNKAKRSFNQLKFNTTSQPKISTASHNLLVIRAEIQTLLYK